MTVNELLQEAKDLNFEAVIIIGFTGKGFEIKTSNPHSDAELIGILDYVKSTLIIDIMKEMKGTIK